MSQVSIRRSLLKKDRAAIKNDGPIQTLMTKRPDQINNWIDTNVTDLDSAKDVLKKLTRVVALLLREQINEEK